MVVDQLEGALIYKLGNTDGVHLTEKVFKVQITEIEFVHRFFSDLGCDVSIPYILFLSCFQLRLQAEVGKRINVYNGSGFDTVHMATVAHYLELEKNMWYSLILVDLMTGVPSNYNSQII